MATIFGFEERNAQGFLDKGVVCLPYSPDGKSDMHHIVSAIKNEDIVFIKHSTSPSDMQIKAVGVVRSDFPSKSNGGICMPVEWLWLGEKVLEHYDEERALRDNALYEEHDILVQREVINLLPDKYHFAQEW